AGGPWWDRRVSTPGTGPDTASTGAVGAEVGEQLTLAGVPAPRRRRGSPGRPAAAQRPVARVVVDLLPAHLDRVFEYEVPAELDEVAQPGVRVRVRFGGQNTTGFLLERTDDAEHTGALVPLRAV